MYVCFVLNFFSILIYSILYRLALCSFLFFHVHVGGANDHGNVLLRVKQHVLRLSGTLLDMLYEATSDGIVGNDEAHITMVCANKYKREGNRCTMYDFGYKWVVNDHYSCCIPSYDLIGEGADHCANSAWARRWIHPVKSSDAITRMICP